MKKISKITTLVASGTLIVGGIALSCSKDLAKSLAVFAEEETSSYDCSSWKDITDNAEAGGSGVYYLIDGKTYNLKADIKVPEDKSLAVKKGDTVIINGEDGNVLTKADGSGNRNKPFLQNAGNLTINGNGLVVKGFENTNSEVAGNIENATTGTLTINDVEFKENYAFGGSAIFNSNYLTLDNVTIKYNMLDSKFVSGGVLYNNGAVTLKNKVNIFDNYVLPEGETVSSTYENYIKENISDLYGVYNQNYVYKDALSRLVLDSSYDTKSIVSVHAVDSEHQVINDGSMVVFGAVTANQANTFLNDYHEASAFEIKEFGLYTKSHTHNWSLTTNEDGDVAYLHCTTDTNVVCGHLKDSSIHMKNIEGVNSEDEVDFNNEAVVFPVIEGSELPDIGSAEERFNLARLGLSTPESVKYRKNGETAFLGEAPKDVALDEASSSNVGYSVVADLEFDLGGENPLTASISKQFWIMPINSQYSDDASDCINDDLVYNGGAQPLLNKNYNEMKEFLIDELDLSGDDVGTAYFASTDHVDSPVAPSEESSYSASIPTETNAGEYDVWVRVVGNKNHNDISAADAVLIGTAKIGQYDLGSASSIYKVVQENDVTYDGNTHPGESETVYIVKVDPEKSSQKGSLPEELIVGTDIEAVVDAKYTYTAINAGDYNIAYSGKADSNFKGTVEGSWTIDKLQEVPSPKEDYTYTAPSIASLEYNGNPQSVLSSGASVNPTSPAVDDATFMYAMTSSATTEPEDGDWKTDYRDLKITDRTELSNKHIWYKIVVDDNHSLPEGARESGAIYLGNPRMTPKPINISWGYNVVIMHNYEDVNDDLRDSLIYAPKASCYGLVPGDEAYPVVKTYDGNPNPKKDPETQITPKAGEEIFLDGNLEISDLREDRTYWAKVVSFTGKDADNYLVDTTTVEALEWQLLPIQEFAEQVLITDIDELIEQVEANTTAINQLNNDIDNICSDIDKISSDIEGLISDISDLEDAYKDADTALKAELEAEINDKESALKDLIKDATDRISDLEDDVAELKSLEATVNNLNTQVTALEAGLSTVNGRIVDLEGQIATLTQAYKDADTALKGELEAEINDKETELKGLINTVDGKIGTLDTKLTKAISDLNDNLSTTISNLETELKNSINNLSSRLDGIDQAYKDADAKLESDFNEKINGLSTRIDGLSTNIADVASKLNDLSKKVNDISKIFEEELNDLEKEIKDAKESIAEEARVRAAADIAEANARKSADDMLIRNLTILSIVFGIGMVASLTLGIIGVAKKKK